MNVEEICNRVNGSVFETEELIFVVEAYIKDRKGVNVNINLSRGNAAFNSIYSHVYAQQIESLNGAFNVASRYFVGK
jgi:hypothetical protein